MKSRATIPVLLVCCGVMLSGCSLVNPHVTWDRPSEGQSVTLQAANEYANRAIVAYKEAAGDQAMLTSGLGLGLIPLSAAALGLGITGASSDAITALGLTGAAGFGAANWLSSKPRQLVYLAGMQAMTCAKDAMRPLDFSDARLTNFQSDLYGDASTSLQQAVGNLESTKINVEQLITSVEAAVGDQASETVAQAKRDVALAANVLTGAKEVLIKGLELDMQVSSAGETLVSAVDGIDAELGKAIVATTPDIQALPSIIEGLAARATQFSTVPKVPDVAGKVSGGEVAAAEKQMLQSLAPTLQTDLEAELRELKDDIAAVTVAANRISTVLASVGTVEPAKSLKLCRAEIKKVDTGITVEPDGDVEFVSGTAATRRLVVTGGKPSYFATLLEAPVAGLTVESKPEGGVAFIKITVTNEEVDPGSYTIHIKDSAENFEMVTVNVAKKPNGNGGESCEGDELADAEKNLTEDQIREIHKALEIPVDGTIGAEFRTAIKNNMKENGLTPTCQNYSATINDLLADSANVAGTGDSDIQMTPATVRKIQCELGIAADDRTDTIDENTRVEVRKFQIATDGLTETGILSRETVNKILDLNKCPA